MADFKQPQSDSFDPYHKWLAIPSAEQPANHYRLLGLNLFERDSDVIAGAADRQMRHVRSFQQGVHAATSQRVLNELSAARLCLLDRVKKAAYDQSLRAELSPAAATLPVARALPVARVVPIEQPVRAEPVQTSLEANPVSSTDAMLGELGFDPIIESSVRNLQPPQPLLSTPMLLLTAIGAIALLMAGMVIFKGSERIVTSFDASRDEAHLASREEEKALEEVYAPKAAPSPKPATGRESDTQAAAASAPVPTPQPRESSAPRKPMQETRSTAEMPTSARKSAAVESTADSPATTDSGPVVSELTEPPPELDVGTPVRPRTFSATKSGGAKPVDDGVATQRAPRPEASSVKATMTRLRELFAKDYAAKRPADKVLLAEKLLALVPETSDATQRFALSEEARFLAVAAGNPALVTRTIDVQAAEFNVDRLKLCLAASEVLAKRDMSVDAKREMVQTGLQWVDEAIAAQRLPLARRLAKALLPVAHTMDDSQLVGQLDARLEKLSAKASQATKADDAPASPIPGG